MNSKMVLVISYFPPNEFGSMTLWTKDKIKALQTNGYKVDLITAPIIKENIFVKIRTYKISSINPSSFFREFNSAKYLPSLLWLPIVLSLGLIHEIVERLILRRIGNGMWGWTFSSLIYIVILNVLRKYDVIISLGGPTSAHLSVALSSFVFKKSKHIIEFQDPIVGRNIGHNSLSSKYFLHLERLLVSSKSKIVFVTNNAYLECKSRFKDKKNIYFIYSSSLKTFNFSLKSNQTIVERETLRIAYFGEMYSNRNYNNFIEAVVRINDLTDMKLFFELIHYGNNPNISYDSLPSNLSLTINSTIIRDKALKEALNYSILLLVQHTDDRSKLTIPYKTWDYLNIQKPILALLNNDELKELLDGLGHYTCNVNNVDSIVDEILRFLDDYKNDKIHIKPNPYDISKQVMELISL